MAGSIKKINGKFRLTLEHGKSSEGKRLRSNETFDSEKEAKKSLNDHNYKHQRNMSVIPAKTTLADLCKLWMDIYVNMGYAVGVN
ncbi:MAG: hypothetical protein WD469_14885 [Paenibacillaceae bacterium]